MNFIFLGFAILVKWGKEESGMSNEFTVTRIWCEACHQMIAFGFDKGITEMRNTLGIKVLECPVCGKRAGWQMRTVPESSRTSIHVFDEMEIGRP